jgi:hypothetical protein
MKTLAVIALVWLSAACAAAQEAAAPEPILRTKLDPPTTVVGQQVTLTIEILAPNYMTKPPELPDLQIRNAVTRQGSTVNVSEQINGTTFAGVSVEFLIYPQEPGRYAVPAQNVTITYAAAPPATRGATVATPALAFEATIPDAAQALDPFVATSRLVARQELKPSSEHLKVGDSVVRTVTIEADGLPAMLLPALSLGPAEGAERYPAQPEFQDKYDSRTGALVSRRTDQATYMLQKAGELDLPAIEIAWWNLHESKVERAHADAVRLSVAENPAMKVRAPDTPRTSLRGLYLFLADHLWPALAIVVMLSAVAWFAPSTIAVLRRREEQRREAYRQSEAFAFSKFRAAARRGDAAKTYFALLDWAAHLGSATRAAGLRALRIAARDPELDAEVAGIERQLFGALASNEHGWRPRHLVRRVVAARKRLGREATSGRRSRTLPTLNPGGSYGAPQRYPVAR